MDWEKFEDILLKALFPCRQICNPSCGWQLEARRRLQSTGPESAIPAEQMRSLGTEACTKGELVVSNTQDVFEVLRSFGIDGPAKVLSAKTFQSIRQLIQEKKARKALSTVGELDDLAVQMMGEATTLSKILQETVDSLPTGVKNDLATSSGGTTSNNTMQRGLGDQEDEEESDVALLKTLVDHAEEDIDEVQVQTRGISDDFTIFNAGKRGTEAFGKMTQKGQVAVELFQSIGVVASKIVSVVVAFVTGGCCDQLRAIGDALRELWKCVRWTELIQRAISAVQRLLKASTQFFQTSWDRITGFLDEFDAAKKVGRFVTSNVAKLGDRIKNGPIREKLKDSKVGRFAKHTIGKLRGDRGNDRSIGTAGSGDTVEEEDNSGQDE